MTSNNNLIVIGSGSGKWLGASGIGTYVIEMAAAVEVSNTVMATAAAGHNRVIYL